MSRVALPVAVLLALGTCAALAGDKQPQEYLDEETAATITVWASRWCSPAHARSWPRTCATT